MSPDRFEHLLTLVCPKITKKITRFRKPISASERLALILRYLATGESQQSLSFSYCIGKSTVISIVSETSLAIFNALKDSYMKKRWTRHLYLCILFWTYHKGMDIFELLQQVLHIFFVILFR